MFQTQIETKYTIPETASAAERDLIIAADAAIHVKEAKRKLGPHVKMTASAVASGPDGHTHCSIWTIAKGGISA